MAAPTLHDARARHNTPSKGGIFVAKKAAAKATKAGAKKKTAKKK